MSNSHDKKSSPRGMILGVAAVLVIAVVALLIVLSLNRSNTAEKSMQSLPTVQPSTSEAKQASDTQQATPQGLFDEESFEISADQITLFYPTRWQEFVRVEKEMNNGSGRLTFYGHVDGHDEMCIFTIHINEDGDIPCGMVVLADGTNIYVNATFSELTFDSSWTQVDQDALCAMQEDVNYLMNALKDDPGYRTE